MRLVRPLALVTLFLLVLSGCARVARLSAVSSRSPIAAAAELATLSTSRVPSTDGQCVTCAPAVLGALTAEESKTVEMRIADLKALGGPCSSYGAVLERSYRGGQITIRPYMWRVGTQLTSGEARPDGAIVLAREIDPLNVGLRSFDELVWSMEHEAVHIAFNLASGRDGGGDRADEYVRSCKREQSAVSSGASGHLR